MKNILFPFMAIALTACQPAENLPSPTEILQHIDVVNTHWQENHPLLGAEDAPFRPYTNNSPFWDNAAYHTGNLAAWHVTGNNAQLDYTRRWAESNRYVGATSTEPAEWRYSYGERPEFVLFGDWQICFQSYAELYLIDKAGGAADSDSTQIEKIARAREVMEYEMSTPANDYWWWADGLYMVMPVMVRLGNITGNPLYGEKLFEYWSYAKELMYDKEEHLFYRDGKYIYPQHQTASGMKDFWARGDGWVLAALARCLEELPADYAHRQEFEQTYLEMAASVAACQQPEGYWTRSLLDPVQAPGPETSGTAFFTYGLTWGIRKGLLPRKEYLPVVERSWQYLTQTALQADGTLGYVQPIGERAIPGQTIDAASTSNFGVGAFLLAASEMYRLVTE
ncbi:MAG: glycoside hydrolase family 88 protein [Bacteroidales bacterium]|nr:glycoside hydrolase family 88 protein [Candidatus Liminaster caballi]